MTADCPTTPEDIAQYQKRGFISYPNFFTPEDLRELADALDHAVEINRARIKGAENAGRGRPEYELVFNQMVNLWTDYAGARKIALNKRLAESARRLSQARKDPHLSRPRTHKTTRRQKPGNQLAPGLPVLVWNGPPGRTLSLDRHR